MTDDSLKIPTYLIKQYLDNCIRHWRKQERKGDETAKYYIDAYQSTRLTLFHEILPSEDK